MSVQPTDAEIITAMKLHGGGFVSRLGYAASYADSENLQILKDAFHDLWMNYTRIAQSMKEYAVDIYDLPGSPPRPVRRCLEGDYEVPT